MKSRLIVLPLQTPARLSEKLVTEAADQVAEESLLYTVITKQRARCPALNLYPSKSSPGSAGGASGTALLALVFFLIICFLKSSYCLGFVAAWNAMLDFKGLTQ